MTSEGTTTAKPRRIHYDTEFLEDGHTISLISIGMVDDAGRELYLINRDAPWHRIAENPWLLAHVVTSLPRAPITDDNPCGINREHLLVVDRHVIAAEVRDFITGVRPDIDTVDRRPAELWAWYGAYDHVALAWLWGPMIDLPEGVPMFTCDIRQWQAQLGNPPLPGQPVGAHNALEDARFNAVRWTWLDGLASGRIGRRELDEVVGASPRPRSAISPGDPDWVEGFGPVPGSGLAAL